MLVAALALGLIACSHVRAERARSGDRSARPTSTTSIQDSYTPHVPARAISYQRDWYALALFSLPWDLFGLWLLLRTGLSARIRDIVCRILRRSVEDGRAPPFRIVAGYYAVFAALQLLWSLPTGLAGLGLEQHFGFARQTVAGFLEDSLKTLGIGMAAIPLVWAAFRIYARYPQHWQRPLFAVIVPVLFFLVVLQPVVVAPLYNRYTPLTAEPLRSHILALAAKCGITGGRVLVEDTSRRTTHVNAYVTGLGPTTRIVVNDTALKELPEDQILAMLGHEMGHYVEGHVWIMFAGATVGVGIFLTLAAWMLPAMMRRWGTKWRLRGMADPAAIPAVLLVISILMLAQDPVANAESRYLEHRADAFGIRVTGLNNAMARLFIGFAERDYSDPRPPALLQFWFGTHPMLSERIRFVREYRSPARVSHGRRGG